MRHNGHPRNPCSPEPPEKADKRKTKEREKTPSLDKDRLKQTASGSYSSIATSDASSYSSSSTPPSSIAGGSEQVNSDVASPSSPRCLLGGEGDLHPWALARATFFATQAFAWGRWLPLQLTLGERRWFLIIGNDAGRRWAGSRRHRLRHLYGL